MTIDRKAGLAVATVLFVGGCSCARAAPPGTSGAAITESVPCDIDGGADVFPSDCTVCYEGDVVVGAMEEFEFPAVNDQTVCVHDGNFVVLGTLRMQPASASVEHVLRFVGNDDANYVGGAICAWNEMTSEHDCTHTPCDPHDWGESECIQALDHSQDYGLWVLGDGWVEIEGTPRTGWLRLETGISAAPSSIELESTPIGWQAGDELVVTPTASPEGGGWGYVRDDFDGATISSGSGTTWSVAWDTGAAAHPTVNGTWTAEVLNLTRNARIEGEATGRAHIFVQSRSSQRIRYARFEHLGPRNPTTDRAIFGRYGIHIHHAPDTAATFTNEETFHCGTFSPFPPDDSTPELFGTLLEGVVATKIGSYSFVPHMSSGVTFRDVVAYDVRGAPFWWDKTDTEHVMDPTHDVTFDRCVAARVEALLAAVNPQAIECEDEDDCTNASDCVEARCSEPDHALTGFLLGRGFRARVTNSVAVGVLDTSSQTSGFHWIDNANEYPGNWRFSGNVAHNNRYLGMRMWMNSREPVIVRDSVAYHNGGAGFLLGAYRNATLVEDVDLFGNGVGGAYAQLEVHGNSHPSTSTCDESTSDGGAQVLELRRIGIGTAASSPAVPVRFVRTPNPAARVPVATSEADRLYTLFDGFTFTGFGAQHFIFDDDSHFRRELLFVRMGIDDDDDIDAVFGLVSSPELCGSSTQPCCANASCTIGSEEPASLIRVRVGEDGVETEHAINVTDWSVGSAETTWWRESSADEEDMAYPYRVADIDVYLDSYWISGSSTVQRRANARVHIVDAETGANASSVYFQGRWEARPMGGGDEESDWSVVHTEGVHQTSSAGVFVETQGLRPDFNDGQDLRFRVLWIAPSNSPPSSSEHLTCSDPSASTFHRGACLVVPLEDLCGIAEGATHCLCDDTGGEGTCP